MESGNEKKLDFSKIDPKKARVGAVCAVMIILLAALCISINMRSHIQGEYTNARDEIGEAVYNNLYMLRQSFDKVNVPGAAVQSAVLPEMREYYVAARALSEALRAGFGERYAVLDAEHIAALDAAFEAYDTAFQNGQSTDAAQASMESCLEMVTNILQTRYKGGVLRAA